jgi:hypothetical protein
VLCLARASLPDIGISLGVRLAVYDSLEISSPTASDSEFFHATTECTGMHAENCRCSFGSIDHSTSSL